jgi:hypothetical protein
MHVFIGSTCLARIVRQPRLPHVVDMGIWGLKHILLFFFESTPERGGL